MKEITFVDKVYKKLHELKPEEEYILEQKVSQQNREEFINVVKEFIRFDYGRAYNYYILFKDDYSSIKKKAILI